MKNQYGQKLPATKRTFCLLLTLNAAEDEDSLDSTWRRDKWFVVGASRKRTGGSLHPPHFSAVAQTQNSTPQGLRVLQTDKSYF